jgi:hypothetical protein
VGSASPARNVAVMHHGLLKAMGYQYGWAIPPARAAGLRFGSAGREAHLPPAQTLQGTGMKSNLKWYAIRATMFLGTMAAAWGFVVDSGRRWF